MDNETFEQISLAEGMIDAPQFLRDGQEVNVLINTETDLPMSVELKGTFCNQTLYNPFLVVTIITPFLPLSPYNAVAELPFNILIL